MRRDSWLATDISAALASPATGVTTRRLEGWTLEGLGADEHLPLHEQVAHYQELSKVAGPGRGRNADLAARRLAAHGFVCSRLRGALLRAFNIDDVAQPDVPLDLSTDELTDAAFERVEEIAWSMSGSIGELPLPMRSIVEKMRTNAYESAESMGETGEAIFHSAIVNFMCLLLGGELYDAQPIVAMFDPGASEIEPEVMDFAKERLRITTWDIDEVYRTAPLAQVAAMALWLREHAHLAVAFLGLEHATESQLDDLAAQFAPFALYLLTTVVSRFDDAAEFIATLHLPVEVTRPNHLAEQLSA